MRLNDPVEETQVVQRSSLHSIRWSSMAPGESIYSCKGFSPSRCHVFQLYSQFRARSETYTCTLVRRLGEPAVHLCCASIVALHRSRCTLRTAPDSSPLFHALALCHFPGYLFCVTPRLRSFRQPADARNLLPASLGFRSLTAVSYMSKLKMAAPGFVSRSAPETEGDTGSTSSAALPKPRRLQSGRAKPAMSENSNDKNPKPHGYQRDSSPPRLEPDR